MSLSYTLRESFSGFRRTKISSTISIITVGVALILLGIFTAISVHTERFLEKLRSQVEVEAFLFEPISTITVDSLGQIIASYPEVDSVAYVSKAEAAAIYKRDTGDDVYQVLSFNPFPPSFKVHMKDGFKTPRHVRNVESRLHAMTEIDTVIYRKSMLETIDQRSSTVHDIGLGLSILVGFSALVLVSNTIRLAIYAKRKLIRTMELVGATRAFIRLPFLLEGIWQGLIGGGLAAAVLFVLITYGIRFFSAELADFVKMEPMFYAGVIGAGGILGVVGSAVSVLRFIRPENSR
jgi:cell division transport system permease protein